MQNEGILAQSYVKSFAITMAYLTEMCDTLIVSFTTIYSRPSVLNESVLGKDAEGGEERCRSLPWLSPSPAKECLLVRFCYYLGGEEYVWSASKLSPQPPGYQPLRCRGYSLMACMCTRGARACEGGSGPMRVSAEPGGTQLALPTIHTIGLDVSAIRNPFFPLDQRSRRRYRL